MIQHQINNRRSKMKLYKLNNGQYLWKSLALEAPCSSLREACELAMGTFLITANELENGLIEMERQEHNVCIFNEDGLFVSTERLDT